MRFKKLLADRDVSTQQMLDELLCLGWIDGPARKIDDRAEQFVSPRRTSHWARSDEERAEQLIREVRMHAAGLAAIEESKSRGLWALLDEVNSLDLVQALGAHGSLQSIFGLFRPRSTLRFALDQARQVARRPCDWPNTM
ncbi:hypothetical protein E7T06_19745 [Deinococcus sp. Arct2-2]|uniref:YdeI/OmpD-associated family protein n=1 Tax=Deinococcus sp. Arct2-2 TaxID=2568653 RepID=UPI0010A2C8B2|nr:hypothetical protein [Deinococcus sp. Arct2-2]THF67734.1 hypothetical protein E7T06_19745 [Deinococcus sp. Arct2-2]